MPIISREIRDQTTDQTIRKAFNIPSDVTYMILMMTNGQVTVSWAKPRFEDLSKLLTEPDPFSKQGLVNPNNEALILIKRTFGIPFDIGEKFHGTIIGFSRAIEGSYGTINLFVADR